MNTKDLPEIAIEKKAKLQITVGKQITALAGIRKNCWYGKQVNFPEDQKSHTFFEEP